MNPASCRAATIPVALFLLLVALPAHADYTRSLPPLHDLRGVGPIKVQVDGMPLPLGEARVTEASLLVSVVARLKEHRIPITDDVLTQAPRLHLTVLAVRHQTVYFLTIQAQLEESCSVSRDPTHRVLCATWSQFPTIKIVEVGEERYFEQVLLALVDQFAATYKFDNDHGGPSGMTSN